MASCSIRSSASAALVLLILATCGVLGATQASQPAPPPSASTKRVIPVTNVVPKGAAEFKNPVLKVEVIEAVDVRSGSQWRTKYALRIKNMRGDRLRCNLKIYFDGELFDNLVNFDLSASATDLTIAAAYGGEGKRAGQMSKLTASATDIRIGD